jgi:hypothetical protein
MSDSLFSKIDEAKKIGVRLARRSAAAESAMRKRDNTLFIFFAKLHAVHTQIRKIGDEAAAQALTAKYGKLPTGRILLKLTYPSLKPKKRSKYAATLRYIGNKKKPSQSVRKFVRENGGINGCVAREKKLHARQSSSTK